VHKLTVLQEKRGLQTHSPQAVENAQQKHAASTKQVDAEIIWRWQLRQSIKTISCRINVGTLYIQAVLRENFVAIMPPVQEIKQIKKAA